MSISQNFPVATPSLNLNFAKTKRLDPRITFTRSSSATYVDNQGILQTTTLNTPRFDHSYNSFSGQWISNGLLIEESRANLCQYSEYITNSYWATKFNVIVTKEVLNGPAGIRPYDKITLSTFTSSVGFVRSTGIADNSNTVYTTTYYLKAGTCRYAGIFYQAYNSSQYGIYVDLQTGTLYNNRGSLSSRITNVGNGWYRVSITNNSLTGGSGRYIFIVPVTVEFPTQGPSATTDISYNSTGEYLYAYGIQHEQGSYETTYIPTTPTFTSRASSATFYDSTGILRTAATNVARSDAYFPDSNGVMRPAGLLLESETTNLLLYSQQFDDAYWTKSNVSVVANAITAPDGTLTADKLVENNTNSVHELTRGSEGSLSIGTDSFITISLYVKAAERNYCYIRSTGNSKRIAIVVDLTNGTFNYTNWASTKNNNATVEKLPNGWYRITATSQSDYPIAPGWAGNYIISPLDSYQLAGNVGGAGYSYQGNGTSGIYIWGAQYELLASASSSYIPTTTASVTRAADISSSSTVTRAEDNASITGTNFSSWYNQNGGTFYVSGKAINGVNARILTFSDTTTGVIFVAANGGTSTTKGIWGPSNLVNVYGYAPFSDISLYSNYRAAATIAPGSYTKYSLNGQIATTNNLPNGSVLNPTVLNIGPNASGGGKGNLISRIAYYPKEFTASEVQNLTK